MLDCFVWIATNLLGFECMGSNVLKNVICYAISQRIPKVFSQLWVKCYYLMVTPREANLKSDCSSVHAAFYYNKTLCIDKKGVWLPIHFHLLAISTRPSQIAHR